MNDEVPDCERGVGWGQGRVGARAGLGSGLGRRDLQPAFEGKEAADAAEQRGEGARALAAKLAAAPALALGAPAARALPARPAVRRRRLSRQRPSKPALRS